MKERKKFCSMRMFEWNQWEREREREREKELNGELLGYILKYKWWCELCANTLSIIYYVSPFSEVHKCTFTNLLMFFFFVMLCLSFVYMWVYVSIWEQFCVMYVCASTEYNYKRMWICTNVYVRMQSTKNHIACMLLDAWFGLILVEL